MRRQPMYFCVDTSGSIRGKRIEAVNSALRNYIRRLKADPFSIESVDVALTTFDSAVNEVVSRRVLEDFDLPEIHCAGSGATFTGAALAHIEASIRRDRRLKPADHKQDSDPILHLFTDGNPTDMLTFQETVSKIRATNFFGIYVTLLSEKVNASLFEQLSATEVKKFPLRNLDTPWDCMRHDFIYASSGPVYYDSPLRFFRIFQP